MTTIPTIALKPPVAKLPRREPRLTVDPCPGCGHPMVDNVDCRCAA